MAAATASRVNSSALTEAAKPKGKRAKVKVKPETVPVATKSDTGTKQYPPKDAVTTKPGGREKIVAQLSPEELKKEIDALIAELRSATDMEEKKKIRRKLRLRGHRGGLGQPRSALTPSSSTGKKATAKVAAVVEEDCDCCDDEDCD